jgi:hypothetical protein
MCGIFGTINSNKPKRFRYTAFASLGIINDSRGGDSCGVFIDGKYEYGTYTKKLFKDFMLESKVLEEFRGKDVSVAIGHCRKASVGAVNEANAQPVIIKDENGNPEFVLIHNGTIRNHDELAKKYVPELDTKDMTDSQIMARIFYKAGYQVLSEYYGGGVFFMVDYRSGKPVCRFFQGYSRQTEYTKELVQERPFYFVYRDDTLVFSSIYEMVVAACPGAIPWEPAANTLYSYSEHGLVAEKEYPRDKVAQSMPAYKTTTTTSYSGTTTGKSLAQRIEDKRSKATTAAGGSSTGATKTTSITPLSSGSGTTTYSASVSTEEVKLPKAPKDQKRTNSELLNKRLTYDYKTSRYLIDGVPVHGCYAVSKFGLIVDDGSTGHVIWFFDGIPFINKGQYFYDRLRALCMDYEMTPREFATNFPDVVRWYSSDRIYRDSTTNILMVATGPKDHKPYTGLFMRLCEIYASKYENGLEKEHSVSGTEAENASYYTNKDQGAVLISTEVSIAKVIKRVCQEIKRS